MCSARIKDVRLLRETWSCALLGLGHARCAGAAVHMCPGLQDSRRSPSPPPLTSRYSCSEDWTPYVTTKQCRAQSGAVAPTQYSRRTTRSVQSITVTKVHILSTTKQNGNPGHPGQECTPSALLYLVYCPDDKGRGTRLIVTYVKH